MRNPVRQIGGVTRRLKAPTIVGSPALDLDQAFLIDPAAMLARPISTN
jgi:hypothetical protein